MSYIRAALAAAVIAVSLATGAPGYAQGLSGRLSLAGQTAWRTGDAPFDIRLAIDTDSPRDQLELAATVFRRVTSRTEFAQTLQNKFRGSVVALTRVALTDLTPADDGTVTLSLTPSLTREGVYPVRIELRDRAASQVLDSFTTHIVNVPVPIEGEPLRAAWVLPVNAPPARQPNGTSRLEPAALGDLAQLAASLDAHPDVPVTLLPTPETMDALAASSRDEAKAAVATFARTAGSHQAVLAQYVPTNLSGLLAAGLSDEASRQLDAGRSVLAKTLGQPADDTTRVLDERLDEAAVGRLRDEGVQRVVVPETTLAPVDLPTTLTQPFQLGSRTRNLPTVAADTGLAAHFTTGRDQVLAAHQFLADLAVIYYDHPGRPGGVAVVPSRSWRPNKDFLEAALGGLTGAPIVVGTTVTGLFANVAAATTSRNAPLVRQAATVASPSTGGLAAGTIRALRSRVEAFATLAGLDSSVVDRLGRTLLVSESSELRARQRQAYLDGVRSQINSEVSRIQMPGDRSITLTAREGDIPVTIRSSAPYPVRVVLTVQSESLLFPLGAAKTIDLTRPNTTETIRVRARSSGSFPLRIRLEAPSGQLLVAQTRFTVRSTATSGVGTILSVGALGFLVIWWGNHLRGRRSKRLVGTAT